MKKEIVKFHNNLNKVPIGNLSPLEQDLLFKILVTIREKEYFISDGTIWLNDSDLYDLNRSYRFTNEEFYFLLKRLKEKFFKLDFTIIRNVKKTIKGKELDLIEEKTINLFSEFSIYYNKDQSTPTFDILNFVGIMLEINKEFAYIIRDLTKDFTMFELKEFMTINSKYSKNLYRLLKQFRNTGYYKIEWNKFTYLLDIPKSYELRDINKRILEPAIKELSKYFKNLKYEKIKDPKGRGRGGKVVGIEFKFTPQEDLKEEPKTPQKDILKPLEKRINHLGEEVSDLTPFINRHFLYKNGNRFEIYKITKIYQGDDNKIYLEGINQDTNKSFKSKSGFSSIEELENKINFI